MKIHYEDIFIVQVKTTCREVNDSLRDKEVIEFGGCFLNVSSLVSRDPFSIIVKPSNNLTQFCIDKTGLSPEDVASGVDFVDLVDFLKDQEVDKMPWASYGSFAQHVVANQCRKNSLSVPMSDRFLNIKSLLPLMFNLKQELSLRGATRELDLGVSDARDCRDEVLNVAILLKEILRGPGATKGNFITCNTKRR